MQQGERIVDESYMQFKKCFVYAQIWNPLRRGLLHVHITVSYTVKVQLA